MPEISYRTRRIIHELTNVMPFGQRVFDWMVRQPVPAWDLERSRVEMEAATNMIRPGAHRAWRVISPIRLTDADDIRVRVDLEPGTPLTYYYRRHQVFHEWGTMELIDHRFRMDDGRRLTYIESWHEVSGHDDLACDRPFPPPEIQPVEA